MIISVINHTNGKISDAEVQTVLRAINRQIAEDFAPYWHMSASLRLEGRSQQAPDRQTLADMRGDAVIYLWDEEDVEGALGYHDRNFSGVPYGFVFTDLAAQFDVHWSVTLSHEALEMLADPEVNLLVQGPHPDPAQDRYVFHWFEMCDAVQAEHYTIEGVAVSNFVLPLYFTGGDEFDGRNDFLGGALRSFETKEGGYVGFFDPATGKHETYARRSDASAARRIELKGIVKATRRSQRYATKSGGRCSSRERAFGTGTRPRTA